MPYSEFSHFETGKKGQQLINQHQLCDGHTFELLNRLEFEITVLYLEYFGNPPLCGLESIQLCASRNLRWLFLYQQQQLDSRHNNGNRQQKQFSFFLCVCMLFCFLPYLFLVLSTQYTVKSIVITCPISTKCATFFWQLCCPSVNVVSFTCITIVTYILIPT